MDITKGQPWDEAVRDERIRQKERQSPEEQKPDPAVAVMPAYQQRVHAERDELRDKVTKLGIFTRSPAFKDLALVDQGDLLAQLEVMRQYESILNRRIARFGIRSYEVSGLR